MLRKYVREANNKPMNSNRYSDLDSFDKVHNYWKGKLSSLANKKEKEKESFMLETKKLSPLRKSKKSLTDRKSRTHFLNERVIGLKEDSLLAVEKK